MLPHAIKKKKINQIWVEYYLQIILLVFVLSCFEYQMGGGCHIEH